MIRNLASLVVPSIRQLARSRSFTIPAICGLALGIGATTAIFSVYYTLLLSSLGFQDVDRLVSLWPTDLQHGQQHVEVSLEDQREWRKRANLLEDVAIASSVNLDFTLTGSGAPQQVESTIVSGSFFNVLGAKPALGRLLQEEDDQANTTKRAVISHRLWQTRFGGQQSVVGTQMRSGTESFTIVGVTSPDFDFPRDVDIWLPVRVGFPSVDQQPQIRVFRSIARMKPGTTVGQVRAQLEVVNKQIAETAAAAGTDRAYGIQVTPMLDEVYGDAKLAIWMIGGSVVLVLLIACANASNLLLARATLRSRELAIRAALGASRTQLIQFLLMEGLILASAAGAAGLLLAKLGVLLISRLAPPDVPRIDQISIGGPVLLFGIGLTFATILIFALVPALIASKRDPQEAFQQSGGTRVSSSRSQTRFRGALVILEVALSTVLLVSAGLLMRSFAELNRVDPGFNPERILTFRVTLSNSNQESRRAFYGQLLTRVRNLPGVESAAAILLRPLSGSVGWDAIYDIEGQSPEEQSRNPNANYEAISPDYFKTMGIRLIAGRDFTSADVHTTSGVAIINESTAKKHWPAGDAIGRHIRVGRDPKQPWLTIVGIVRDVRYREWEAARPDLYIPYTQRAQLRSDFVIKTHGDPTALLNAVRNEVSALDPEQAVSNVTTMESLVDRALARSRFNSTILGILAQCALVLAAIGLYGVLSYAVAQRIAEIGIRMAIGASPWDMVRMVTMGGVRLAIYGTFIGVAAAWMVSTAYSALLFKINPLDPLTYIAAIAGLWLLAALAAAGPAIRAAKVDPIRTLQSA
jgi:putative ABC transport system permease protein